MGKEILKDKISNYIKTLILFIVPTSFNTEICFKYNLFLNVKYLNGKTFLSLNVEEEMTGLERLRLRHAYCVYVIDNSL